MEENIAKKVAKDKVLQRKRGFDQSKKEKIIAICSHFLDSNKLLENN